MGCCSPYCDFRRRSFRPFLFLLASDLGTDRHEVGLKIRKNPKQKEKGSKHTGTGTYITRSVCLIRSSKNAYEKP